tara:strand:- start:446 stop:700 length:255 start_codon:yes stop_codon:yes gene_type:complete
MNDHQDSEHFSYSRSWEEIEGLLFAAEQEQNKHYMLMQSGDKKNRLFHMRNYKGLEGVINALRWVLGDLKINRGKVLGRDKRER